MMEDWAITEICEIGEIITGGTPSKKNQAFYSSKDYPFYKPTDLNKGINVLQSKDYLSKLGFENSRKAISNSVLVTCIGATIGKTGLIKKEGAFNQQINAVIPNNTVSSIFLFYQITGTEFQGEIKRNASSTTLPILNKGKFSKLNFRLPPLPIQRAIVSKIESLFSSLDSGIADLKKAQEQLKIYRQAVLKKAFEGELTKEWREQQTKLIGAKELLEQIEEERQIFYEKKVATWKIAIREWEGKGSVGKKPSRISKPKFIQEVGIEDVENYTSIPALWHWTRFGNVTYKIGDIDHKMPKTTSEGMPYLSTGNIKKDGTIDFENAKIISYEDFKRLALKIKPEKGDIIFPRYGTIGRNILIAFDKEFLVSYSCAIIKNITKLMNPKFALHYSLSPVIKKEITRYTVQTTQANIGIASIELFVFPLCSNEEQNQIVKEIESRLSVCDKVEESIIDSLLKAKALRQSVLKKAFEGKLLTVAEIERCKQEADYEPARVLLERIKKEKKK